MLQPKGINAVLEGQLGKRRAPRVLCAPGAVWQAKCVPADAADKTVQDARLWGRESNW